MERQVSSPARFRFIDRFLFVVLPLFFLDLVLGWWGCHYHHLHLAGALAVVCAALQSLPIMVFIVIVGLYLAEETDDFQRALYVQSLLWGKGRRWRRLRSWEAWRSTARLRIWMWRRFSLFLSSECVPAWQ